MPKLGIEFDEEAQKKLEVPLGKREIYPSVGKYIAEVLKEHGVTFAFGCPGGHIWHFVDAISRIGIKLVIFGHEQNAVYCGEAYAQVTQKPAVCFGTVGPGTANSFSPMQQAFLSHSPIIYLAGGIEQEHDRLYNTIQESIAAEFFTHVTKWSQRVFYPWSVKQFLTRGFKVAQAAPKGPVAFEMGIDLLLTMDEVRKYYWGGYWPQHANYIEKWRGEDTAKPLRSGADPEDVARAAKRIMEAKKPFAILGDYCTWDQATEELEEFINLTKIPFNTRRIGRAAVSEKHPYHHRGFPPFRNEIDLMIPIGLKVGFFDGYAAGWPESIQIAPCESWVWTYINTHTALVGNIKTVIKQLNDYIKANNLKPSPEREEWLKRCQESHAQAMERRKARAYKYGPDHPRYRSKNILHYGYCSQVIREVCDELYDSKVRVMIDGYTMSDFVMPYLLFTRPASCITANDQAGVGHGVGQAIGAALGDLEMGRENIPVLALMGDSGMMNAAMDIEVAVRYKLPIVYLVTNNSGWMPGMKYPWYGPNWDILGEQDVVGNEWMGRYQWGEERPIDIRFDKLAEVFGGHGMLCNSEKTFREDLKKAFSIAEKGTPVIMNCIMDQHLVNKAVTGPVYVLMYAHIPWDELPIRGKHARRTFLGNWFEGLKDYPEMPPFDPWEPLSEDEFGYEPRREYFK